ncbi:hypothetical protein FA13DRAFT_1715278 [Coprinellus micaceus]|uniref:Uncharacterized protein n=1 Tax=Coprinellus micaceus TaxID=71717 RepID=A0A4Y7SP14_COPMI|nr:hypothetical protein FA13DRAFT_1715278 [Coprinellus micaceus]
MCLGTFVKAGIGIEVKEVKEKGTERGNEPHFQPARLRSGRIRGPGTQQTGGIAQVQIQGQGGALVVGRHGSMPTIPSSSTRTRPKRIGKCGTGKWARIREWGRRNEQHVSVRSHPSASSSRRASQSQSQFHSTEDPYASRRPSQDTLDPHRQDPRSRPNSPLVQVWIPPLVRPASRGAPATSLSDVSSSPAVPLVEQLAVRPQHFVVVLHVRYPNEGGDVPLDKHCLRMRGFRLCPHRADKDQHHRTKAQHHRQERRGERGSFDRERGRNFIRHRERGEKDTPDLRDYYGKRGREQSAHPIQFPSASGPSGALHCAEGEMTAEGDGYGEDGCETGGRSRHPGKAVTSLAALAHFIGINPEPISRNIDTVAVCGRLHMVLHVHKQNMKSEVIVGRPARPSSSLINSSSGWQWTTQNFPTIQNKR